MLTEAYLDFKIIKDEVVNHHLPLNSTFKREFINSVSTWIMMRIYPKL